MTTYYDAADAMADLDPADRSHEHSFSQSWQTGEYLNCYCGASPDDEEDLSDLPDEPEQVLCKHLAGPECEEC